MLIMDDTNRVVVLENIYTPLVSKYFWITDLKSYDFTLDEIKLLELMTGPCVDLWIDGFSLTVPASWYVLIGSNETSEVDIVKAQELTRGDFTAVVCGPSSARLTLSPIRVTDFKDSCTSIAPRLHKYQMLCHPISATHWISISPFDVYSKSLKNCVLGDFL